MLTLEQARHVLQRPIFGDPGCIEARDLIRKHNARVELIALLEKNGEDCSCKDCHGTGKVKCFTCDGDGGKWDDFTLRQLVDKGLKLNLEIDPELLEEVREQ